MMKFSLQKYVPLNYAYAGKLMNLCLLYNLSYYIKCCINMYFMNKYKIFYAMYQRQYKDILVFATQFYTYFMK